MRGVYRQPFLTGSLSSGPSYLIQLTAPANAVVEILEANVSPVNNATNQDLDMFFQRASVAGTGATPLTPSKTESGDQNASSTLAMTPSGAPTLTANTIQGGQGVQSLGGYVLTPLPEDRIYVPPSGIIVLVLNTTAFSATIFRGELVFREIG